MRVVPGGSGNGAGTSADVAVVAAELGLIPAALLDGMADQEVKVVVCHDNVTNVVPGLINDVPRNWCTHPEPRCARGQACRRPGVCWTWANVPGMYRPGEREVVIATRDGLVPKTGNGHGSANLVVHETLHAADYVLGKPSDSDIFRRAWRDDENAIRSSDNHDYYMHPASGREESYSESGARWYARHPTLRTAWPKLAAYWARIDHRIAAGETPFAGGGWVGHEDQFWSEDAFGEAGLMGYGTIGGDGTATLFLRAEGHDGEHGHGAVTISVDALPPRLRARVTLEASGYAAGRRSTFVVPNNFEWSTSDD